MVRSGDLAGGRDATENRRDPGIFFVCERLGSVRAVLSGNFRVWRDQRVWRARLRDERRDAPGAAAVQEGGFARDAHTSRWGRRTTFGFRHRFRRTEQLGD